MKYISDNEQMALDGKYLYRYYGFKNKLEVDREGDPMLFPYPNTRKFNKGNGIGYYCVEYTVLSNFLYFFTDEYYKEEMFKLCLK